MTNPAFKESVLEIQVNAALAGHDFGPFEPVDTLTGGHQVTCQRCGMTSRVGHLGVRYCLLETSVKVTLRPVLWNQVLAAITGSFPIVPT